MTEASSTQRKWAAWAVHQASRDLHDVSLPEDPYARRIATRNWLITRGNQILAGTWSLGDHDFGKDEDSSIEGDLNEQPTNNPGNDSRRELDPMDDPAASFDHLCNRLARTSVRHT